MDRYVGLDAHPTSCAFAVVRSMCRLRSVFLSRGVAVNDGIYDAKSRLRWLAKLTPPHRRLAQRLGRQLDQLVPLRGEAEEWLHEEARTHPIIRTLATAPGMGPIRTALVVAITANPYRFRTRRQYSSYRGFGILTRSSSDWVQGKDGRWEHPLHKDYERMLAAGIRPNLAKLTLAQKIAATVLSMWKHQEVYDPQRHRLASDKTQAPSPARRRRPDAGPAHKLEKGSRESIQRSAGIVLVAAAVTRTAGGNPEGPGRSRSPGSGTRPGDG